MLRRILFSFVVFGIILVLSACGANVTTPPPAQQPEAETQPPAPTATAQAEQTPVETLAPAIDPFAPVADAVLSRVQDTQLGMASLFRLLSQPFEGGEIIVFQFQDSVGEETAYCTGLAVVLLTGEVYTVSDISVACTRERPTDPITAFTPSGPTAYVGEGETPALVVFGEIYSADVVAIRVFDTEGADFAAQISGGGWFAALPPEAEVNEVVAYNEAGEAIFTGGLTSRPPVPQGEPTPAP